MTGSVEYFVILSVIQPGYNQAGYATVARTLSVGPKATRLEIFELTLTQLPEHMRQNINVLFFSAEPNSVAGNGSPLARAGAEGGAES
jgi:hypothetical protein